MSPQQERVIVAAVRSGRSTAEIAAMLDCSDTTVRAVRQKHGCSAPTGRVERKPWRVASCPRCGATFRTKRDLQVLCGQRCKLAMLHERRWKLPQDSDERRELLQRLYWTENHTTTEIAALFGMRARSIGHAMESLGIPRRVVGQSRHSTCCEPDCVLPIHRVKHKTNGSWYGRRCRLHWIIFRMEVNQRYNDKHLGKDDEAWLRRLRQLLARVQRLNHAVSQSLNPVSAPATTSRG